MQVFLFIIVLELVAQIIFLILKRVTVAKTFAEVFEHIVFEVIRGLAERLMLTAGLVSGLPQVLIPFGVLKLQNRIGFERDNEDEKKENARAYFLFGNVLTITLSILYAQLVIKYGGWDFRLYQP